MLFQAEFFSNSDVENDDDNDINYIDSGDDEDITAANDILKCLKSSEEKNSPSDCGRGGGRAWLGRGGRARRKRSGRATRGRGGDSRGRVGQPARGRGRKRGQEN